MMISKFAEELYPFQNDVHNFLKQGKPVILHAPTGVGKTRASLYPYFWAWELEKPFPRQAIYSVPMRVLANQFFAEYNERANIFGFQRPIKVTRQTGEYPEDSELRGDLIFTTIDQTLSNLLGVPYSVSGNRGNLNAGAVLSSYLVFDEFHLFPLGDPRKANGALVTMLQLLRALKGLIPFTLMTATFSKTLLDELCILLNAEKVSPKPEEFAKIPSQQRKSRRFFVMEKELSSEAILDRHHSQTIVVCNTVERAIDVYQNLVAMGCRPIPFSGYRTLEDIYAAIQKQPGWEFATWVLLIHSRFEQGHRALKESILLREFGKNNDASIRRIPSIILVATQVVEVGLDVTSQTLHTEIAPANAIIQRGGRCARFADEHGEVYIYKVPTGTSERYRYAPYMGLEAKQCDYTWAAFKERSGTVLDFKDEQDVVDMVHKEADQILLEAMYQQEGEIWSQIFKAIGLGDVAQRQNLVRRVDSRVLLVHDTPETLGNPYRCKGFTLWQGTLKGKWNTLETWRKKLGLPWMLKYPVEIPTANELLQEPLYQWKPVINKSDLSGHIVFVIHPSIVLYDAEMGFRLTEAGGGYRSLLMSPMKGNRRDFIYQLEDYPTHIHKMIKVYGEKFHKRISYTVQSLEHRLGISPGTLERAILLALALHDVGKMTEGWQQWAQAYQGAIGEPIEENMIIAHTHLETEKHRQIERSLHIYRPPHAGEGAVATSRLLHEALDGNYQLRRATMSAIARHHSSLTATFGKYKLHPAAGLTIKNTLEQNGVPASEAAQLAENLFLLSPETNLQQHLLRPPPEDPLDAWFVYFLIVRCLRLADGESQERGDYDGPDEEDFC